jgi:hypothetical protein
MATKFWYGMLWAVAVASGCSNAAEPSLQPTAAVGASPAGAAAPAVPTAGTPSAPLTGAAGATGSTGPGAAGSGMTASQPPVTAGSSAGPSQAGQPGSLPPKNDAPVTMPPPGNQEPAAGFDYPAGEVAVSTDLVIPAGKTARVGPGTKFKVNGADVKVQVFGELVVRGTQESPAAFGGGGAPKSWHGIVIEKGGKLTLEHAQISGANYGIFAMPGSDFTVDSTVIDTSFKAAVIQSNGSFTRTRFVATVPNSVSLASEVSVDDPNGALTIIDASPTITDCRFDGASSLTDLVRIGGMSSPTFDHVYLHDAHCAFHTFGGTNTSARITNALIENFSYGFMAYTTKPIVENSVFMNNSADFGICLGATEDNAPGLKSNFYSSGEVSLDPSCFNIGIADASPASAVVAGAGTTTKF